MDLLRIIAVRLVGTRSQINICIRVVRLSNLAIL